MLHRAAATAAVPSVAERNAGDRRTADSAGLGQGLEGPFGTPEAVFPRLRHPRLYCSATSRMRSAMLAMVVAASWFPAPALESSSVNISVQASHVGGFGRGTSLLFSTSE